MYATSLMTYHAQTALKVLPLSEQSGAALDPAVAASFISRLAAVAAVENPYYRNISAALCSSLHNDAASAITTAMWSQTALCLIAFAVFTLWTVAWYVPALRRLTLQVFATQGILLLFPNDVLESVPSLHAQIQAVVLGERKLSEEAGAQEQRAPRTVPVWLKDLKSTTASSSGRSKLWFTASLGRVRASFRRMFPRE